MAFIRKANASDYGGELWVLDLSPEREPLAAPRRLVDPATLPSTAGGSASDGTAPRIVAPRTLGSFRSRRRRRQLDKPPPSIYLGG